MRKMVEQMINSSKIHELITYSANVLLSILSPVNMRARAESPEPQSQGSNTAKAHLIFVQNIDFLCPISGQISSRCYSFSRRCFMVCDVSTGESG